MSDLNLKYLDEAQNEAFDTEYHSVEEMNNKLALIRLYVGDQPFTILDLGGGNGRFLDKVLEFFPNAQGTLLDVSQNLLDQNVPHARKHLIRASVDELPRQLPLAAFDLITVNWLLHHLVGPRYSICRSNSISLLQQCKGFLKPNGRIIVAENMFDGFMNTNIPSLLIYSITRVQSPWFVKIVRRFFNTAGVGVCFNSRLSWNRIFREAGLDTYQEYQGIVWHRRPVVALALRCLGIREVSTRHFYLGSPDLVAHTIPVDAPPTIEPIV